MNKQEPVKKETPGKKRRESSPGTQKRAELINALQKYVEQRQGTQADKAAALGITQPRLNDLLKNRVNKFSLDALVALASKAGLRVNVNTQPIWLEKIPSKFERVRPTFAPEPGQLGQLDAREGTELLLTLLRCEAMANGLSPKDVLLSLNLNTNDDGIDAKVEKSPEASGLLAKGNTYYQIKTGSTFKPWQPSALKKELFGKSHAIPLKRDLSSEIRRCLDENGTYILITFGHDLTPSEHTRATLHLVELLTACGYSNPKVAIYGQGQLVGELEKYPSICLKLKGLADGGFLSIEGWKKYAQMQVNVELGDEQRNFINKIRTAIREDTVQHIRIIGEPGIGKTRLVLEAVSTDDIAPSIIYVPTGEDFQKSKLFNELVKPDMLRAVTLVVDDCDNRDRSSIWSALKGRDGINLITIDHGPEESHDSAMEILHCPRLPEEQIKNILFNYLQQNADLSNWAEWCSGSPRVAHAVGENLRSNPDDLLKPPADVPIWDRFIIGHKEMDSRDAEQHRIVLRHIALFQRFGFENPVDDEAQFIVKQIQLVDPTITWGRFQTIVEHYRKKRILQGRHTLFIVPKALHIYLWVDFWNQHGRGFDFHEFLEQLPETMKDWFLRLFIYAHGAPPAQNVVKNILSARGPFSDHNFLVSDVGLRFIRYLSEADPESTLALLERTVKNWTQEELYAWETGRQEIVWALEKIAVWDELFDRAVSVLIPMALEENAKNSNNSKGLLLSFFTVGLGWAPTQAPPAKRYPILRKLVVSKDVSQRALGLELCEAWLDTHGGTRIIGAEYQGLKPTVEFWRPKTYGEVFDEWRRVLQLLHVEMKGFDVVDRNRVAEVIVQAAQGLLRVEAMADEVLDILFSLVDDKEINRKPLTQFVISQLRMFKDDLNKDILRRLGKLDMKLTGTSLWDRTNRYVLHTNWDEDYQFRGDECKDLRLPSRRVQKLAEEYMQDIAIFSEYIPKLLQENGHRLHELGLECGKLADKQYDNIIWDHLFTKDPEINGMFLGGYLAGIRLQNESRWEQILSRLLDNEWTRKVGVQCVWSSGFTESIIRDMLVLYKENKIDAYAFNRFAFRQDRDALPDNLFQEIIRALLDKGDDASINVGVRLVQHFYFGSAKKKDGSTKEFPGELVFELLTTRTSENNNEQMYGYYWDIIARNFIYKHPDRKIDLFRHIVGDMGLVSRYGQADYIAKVADDIVREHPRETWEIISELLISETKNRHEIIYWLGETGFVDDPKTGAINYMPADEIIDWVKEDVEERCWLIREVLPKTLHIGRGGQLTRLFIEEFYDYDHIADSLFVHFHMGGWCGHESDYLSKKRDEARCWVSEVDSSNIQLWLRRYIDYLSNRIESCKISEEREF